MSVADQIREEAIKIADTQVDRVLANATKLLACNRLSKIRKGKAIPVNQKEADYAYSIKMYVWAKLSLRKLGPMNREGIHWRRREDLQREMYNYRAVMDYIEFGFPYTMPLRRQF